MRLPVGTNRFRLRPALVFRRVAGALAVAVAMGVPSIALGADERASPVAERSEDDPGSVKSGPVEASEGTGAAEDSRREDLRARILNGTRHLGRDARYLVTFPTRRTKKGVLMASAVLGGTVLLYVLDDEIRREVQDARNGTLDRWESRIEPFGGGAVTGGGGVLVYLGGRISGDERVTETGRSIVESVFFTQLFTVAAKASFGRDRPSPGRDADEFFNAESAFPSGHTSRAFAVATVLARRHGRLAAWLAYPIAGLVGLARIESDVHWASDVLAGAALGYGVARGVLHARQSRRPGGGLTIFPSGAPGGNRGAGLVVRWSF